MSEDVDLEKLGSERFERVAQSLLKHVIGDGTTSFGPGKDGAREATFRGAAPYPSLTEQWTGDWIFQAKYHNLELLGTDRARATVLRELDNELDRIVNQYKHSCDNYILITNVPLSGVFESGTIDSIKAVARKYVGKVKNVHVWGQLDVSRLLLKYPDARTEFPELLLTGDLIIRLLSQLEDRQNDLSLTISSYLLATYTSDGRAQLDQAGEVADTHVPLDRVFTELHAFQGEVPHRHKLQQMLSNFGQCSSVVGERHAVDAAKFLLSEGAPKVVLVGGPGEGKSTLGQYVAQIHRAALLGRIDEVCEDIEYFPPKPRIPLRLQLRDLAQWLSSLEDPRGGSIEGYLVDQIRSHTSREVSPNQVHEIMQKNPVLLILDGLDEVTEPDTRELMLAKLEAFMERCERVLDSDIQVLASTRPRGYLNQFDNSRYLHLELGKLSKKQIRSYAQKWCVAKKQDPDKMRKTLATLEECIADSQISLLMTTPLQVTILLLIVSSGGTPPRQREALFDEYLEVMYKRETGKGRSVVVTEKELLIGLHRYIGYLLHEFSARGINSGSTLNQSEYDVQVATFLRRWDPFCKAEVMSKRLKNITRDAGERLVLIVEAPAGAYGFELRSIQEFFAAAHLTDTAQDTEQRYLRFTVIALLPHWRNVALFFAGRVGRNFPGEAKGIVSICEELDQGTVERHLLRGAALALDLAGDRAFGPERTLQHRLVAHALRRLDVDSSDNAVAELVRGLRRLPEEDIDDLVAPLVLQRLEIVAPRLHPGYLRVLWALGGSRRASLSGIRELARNSDPALAIKAVEFVLEASTSDNDAIEVLEAASGSADDAQLASFILEGDDPTKTARSIRLLFQCLATRGRAERIVGHYASFAGYFFGHQSGESIAQLREPDSGLDSPQKWERVFAAVQALIFRDREMGFVGDYARIADPGLGKRREQMALPYALRTGRVLEWATVDGETSLLLEFYGWALHLIAGDATEESYLRFEESARALAKEEPWVLPFLQFLGTSVHKVFGMYSYVLSDGGRKPELRHARQFGLTTLNPGTLGSENLKDLTALAGTVGRYVGGITLLETSDQVEGFLQQYAACLPTTIPKEAVRSSGLRALYAWGASLGVDAYLHMCTEIRSRGVSANRRSEILRILCRGVELQPERRDGVLAGLREVLDWGYRKGRLGKERHILDSLLLVILDIAQGFPEWAWPYFLDRHETRGELPSLHVGGSYGNSGLLETIFDAAANPDIERSKAGQTFLADFIVSATSFDAWRPPRISRLVTRHRALMRSECVEARTAAVAVFLMRSPSSSSDFAYLRECFLNDASVQPHFWSRLFALSSRLGEDLESWLEFCRGLVVSCESDPVRLAIAVDSLRVLLERDSQSIATVEMDLALPLAAYEF